MILNNLKILCNNFVTFRWSVLRNDFHARTSAFQRYHWRTYFYHFLFWKPKYTQCLCCDISLFVHHQYHTSFVVYLREYKSIVISSYTIAILHFATVAVTVFWSLITSIKIPNQKTNSDKHYRTKGSYQHTLFIKGKLKMENPTIMMGFFIFWTRCFFTNS